VQDVQQSPSKDSWHCHLKIPQHLPLVSSFNYIELSGPIIVFPTAWSKPIWDASPLNSPWRFFCVSHKHHLTSVNYIILHHNLEYHKISQILKEHFGVQVPIIFPQSPRNASASLSLLITVAPCAPLPAAKPLVPDLLSLACGGRRGRKGHWSLCLNVFKCFFFNVLKYV